MVRRSAVAAAALRSALASSSSSSSSALSPPPHPPVGRRPLHSPTIRPLVLLRRPPPSSPSSPPSRWSSSSPSSLSSSSSRSCPPGATSRGGSASYEREGGGGGGLGGGDGPRVKVERLESGIATVTLNRPDKLNCLDLDMFESIASAASRIRDDPSVRAVVLRGEGRGFCSGLDFKSVVASGPRRSVERLLERPSGYGRRSRGGAGSEEASSSSSSSDLGNLAQDVAYLWRDVDAPVIAAIHGVCFGGGLQIALGADLRIAAPDSRISVMEGKWGLIPDMSASVTLRELVRIDVAKELAMTGRVISGEEAARLGLVTRCSDDPVGEAIDVAGEIAERSPDAVAAAKRLFQETWVSSGEGRCLRRETELQRTLLGSWNQLAASGRAITGVGVPYGRRGDASVPRGEEEE